jgi:ketosteroid isomerase-like protein
MAAESAKRQGILNTIDTPPSLARSGAKADGAREAGGMQGKFGRALWIGAALAAAGCATIPFMALPAAAPLSASRDTDLEALLEADRAFSRAGRSSELAAALAAIFDEEVVMVAPRAGFVRGRDRARETLAASPANAKAKAEWAPLTGGLSADGGHGFTLGYMHIALADGTRREAKYVAYWTKKPAGWRVALYRRSARPEGKSPAAVLPLSLPETRGRHALHAGTRDELLAAERAFAAEAGASGIGEAFRRYGTPGSINSGGGAGFLLGAEAIADAVAAGLGSAKISWAPDDALIAPSGDLGVTWGWIRLDVGPGETRSIPYFTVWRRHAQGWRYAAE